MELQITLTGTTALLQHNSRLANRLDPIARALRDITDKRTKTDEDYENMAELEFRGALYHDEELGPYEPGLNVEKSFVEGARITKQGKQVERGLFITDNELPLIYPGPRTLDALWADESFRSVLPVRVGTSRVQRCRPLFRQWTIEAIAEVDPALLDLDTVRIITANAGSMVGLGDYRPRYGRYVAAVEKL